VTPSEKYRIKHRLGNEQRRKFGDVFLVEDKITGELGTLKMIGKTENELRESRLRAEAGFAFDHPQLPRTLYTFESETELVVVKNHFPGIPLTDFMKSVKTKRKPQVLLQLLQQLSPIFDELNRAQIVHLDIKPSNLIINGTPEQFEVYLIDFGMAMRTNETDARSTLFPLGYAAPELLLNRLHLADQRTDLFALGIVLWQSFTGKLPLLHPNPSITTNLQLTHPLPDHDDIPKRYLPILKRLCAKHSFGIPPNQLAPETMDTFLKEAMDQRYANLEEVISDWEKALEKKRWFGF
jgi:eukaryotic-like serine/threonine-protein kinase